MEPAAAKQQIIERLRQASNVLVTVSNNPSVDQLAACIGLTLLLNKMEKHTTAVFSGQVPSTIEFLQPAKTLETNTDSLRDFIISLDKEKADKLRYKVEDQVVKIFITPYKTSLSEKDLVFSQGDFNVEVVVALGIRERSQIDAAITAHGRILHDATIISVNTGEGKAPDLGQINWLEPTASSLSEMLVSISEAFGGGLLDNQIATAFLTGIVAETNRFSNPKTTPKVMTMSAQLMAAGANQQLIVAKLGQPEAAPLKPAAPKVQEAKVAADGSLSVPHDVEAKLQEAAQPRDEETKPKSDEIHIDEQGNLKTAEQLIKPLPPEAKEEEPPADQETAQPQTPLQAVVSTEAPQTAKPAEPPAEAKPSPEDMPGSHNLLNPDSKPPFLESAFTANTQPEWQNPYDSVPIDPLNGDGPGKEQTFQHKTVVKPLSEETAAKAEAADDSSPSANVDKARDAVQSALADQPFDPGLHPEERQGAAPLGPELHEETPAAKQPESGTPELSLPLPASPADSTGAKASPPSVPPPLITNANVVIPASGQNRQK